MAGMADMAGMAVSSSSSESPISLAFGQTKQTFGFYVFWFVLSRNVFWLFLSFKSFESGILSH